MALPAQKPDPFFNRADELAALDRACRHRGRGGQMMLLYGRRRDYDQALLDMKRAERLDPATQTYQEAVEQIRREKDWVGAQPAP